jgi:hypothetical protein
MYLAYSYPNIFWLTAVQNWSNIRPELKCVSRRIIPGFGPLPPIATLPLQSGFCGFPILHNQKESRFEETLRR